MSRSQAFSPAVYLTALTSVLVTILMVDALKSPLPIPVTAVGILTILPSIIVVWLGHRWFNRLNATASRGAVSFLTYMTAIDLKFGLAALVNERFDIPARPVLEALLGQGTPTIVAVVIIIRILVKRADHLLVAGELEDEQGELIAASEHFEERVAEAQASLSRQVSAELAPTMAEVRAKLRALGEPGQSSATDAIDTLSRAVSDVVRPMSHALVLAETNAELHRRARTAPQPKLDLLHAKLDITRILNLPLLLGLEFAEALVWGPLFHVVSSSVLGDVANTFITGAIAGAMVLLWPTRWRRMSMLRATANILVIYLLSLAIPRVWLHFNSPEYFFNPYLAAHLVDRVGLLLLFVVGGALVQLDAQTRAELRRVNSELATLVARLRRELGAHRKRLSWLLHGPIQSALVSAAIGLSRAESQNVDVTSFNARIDDAVAQIQSGFHRHNDIDQAIAQITGVWSDAMTFEVDLEPEARELLSSEPSLSEAAAEVLTEATSNAFRHGSANAVSISLRAENAQRILITVRNNGRHVDPEHVAGLGSRLLSELCLHWELRADGEDTVFTAILV